MGKRDLQAVATGARRRLTFGIVEQGSTAALNFIVVAGAARVLVPSDFGTFALLNGTYVLLQSVSQAVVSETMIVTYSSATPDRRAGLLRAALQGALLSLIFGGASIGVALCFGLGISVAWIVGVVVAFGLISDAARGLLVATERTRQASLVSTMGLMLVVAGYVLLPSSQATLLWPLVIWGLAYLPALIYVLTLSLRYLLAGVTRTLHSSSTVHTRVQRTLLAEALLAGSAQYVALLSVDAAASREDAGSLRLAIALIGPVSVLFNAVRLYGVAELRRRPPTKAVRLARQISGLMALFAGAGGICLYLVPLDVGRELLGANWVGAHDLILWAALQKAAIGVSLGYGVVLRARHELRRPLHVRLVTSPLAVLGAFVGGTHWGAAGALVGLTIAAALQALGLFVVMKDVARGER